MAIKGEKHRSLESTQEALKALLKARGDLPHLYSVMAEIQTAGRGRSDHTWVSLQGNLHVSILIRELPFSEITWVPLWVSVCIHRALGHLGVDKNKIQLKWPNDLWIEHSRKIGGTLCEKIGPDVVVGIGLNLLESPNVDQKTGSVSNVSGVLLPEIVLGKILEELAQATTLESLKEYYERYALFGDGDLIEWKNESSGEQCSGTVVGLGSYGELLVNKGNKIIPLFAEDVRSSRIKE